MKSAFDQSNSFFHPFLPENLHFSLSVCLFFFLSFSWLVAGKEKIHFFNSWDMKPNNFSWCSFLLSNLFGLASAVLLSFVYLAGSSRLIFQNQNIVHWKRENKSLKIKTQEIIQTVYLNNIWVSCYMSKKAI